MKKKINLGIFIGKIINEIFLEEKNINPLMKENDKEDDKEDEKENKKNSNINELELGLLMMDKLFDNEAFVNMTSEIAKKFDIQQLMSNITNQLELEKFQLTPEEFDNCWDKDKKLDMEALYKRNFGKFGYSENEQDLISKKVMKLVNNPNIKKIANDAINENNQNNNINKDNIVKNSEDNNIIPNFDLNNLLNVLGS